MSTEEEKFYRLQNEKERQRRQAAADSLRWFKWFLWGLAAVAVGVFLLLVLGALLTRR